MRQMVRPPRRTRVEWEWRGGENTAAVTQGFVIELEAKSQEKGQNEVNERFAIAQQLKVGGFIVKIDGEGAVLAGRFGALSHVSSSVEMAVGADEISCG